MVMLEVQNISQDLTQLEIKIQLRDPFQKVNYRTNSKKMIKYIFIKIRDQLIRCLLILHKILREILKIKVIVITLKSIYKEIKDLIFLIIKRILLTHRFYVKEVDQVTLGPKIIKITNETAINNLKIFQAKELMKKQLEIVLDAQTYYNKWKMYSIHINKKTQVMKKIK